MMKFGSNPMRILPLSAFLVFAHHAQSAAKPNVILVLVDDQGYGDLGAHGNPYLKTPEIDSFYNHSLRFVNYHVDPTCSPSRSALMTGMYSRHAGVWHTINGRSLMRASEMTMADVFRNNGYRTAIFGKWHLGDNYPFRPQDNGFEEVLINGGGGVTQAPDYWGNDLFDDTYRHNGVDTKYSGYCTDIWFGEAEKYITAHKHEPFFVYLPLNAAHHPWYVDKSWSAPYASKPGAPNDGFYGMIANIDWNFGKFRKFLQDENLEHNTILIYSTDNGTTYDNAHSAIKNYGAGMRGTKGEVEEGGHRVPFFIRYPDGGIDGGRDDSTLVAHFDLLPTFIDWLGLTAPKKADFDGISLKDLMLNKKSDWPDRYIVVESQRKDMPSKTDGYVLMTQQHRLIKDNPTSAQELYAIQGDLGETNDLVKKNPPLVAKLNAYYDEWWNKLLKYNSEFQRIVWGHDKENPLVMSSMDWHPVDGTHEVWNQDQVENLLTSNGVWKIRVIQKGTYAVSLRKFPVEKTDGHITEATARIKIGSLDTTAQVTNHALDNFTFTVQLDSGNFDFRTWLGSTRGAYYVRVERTSPNAYVDPIEDTIRPPADTGTFLNFGSKRFGGNGKIDEGAFVSIFDVHGRLIYQGIYRNRKSGQGGLQGIYFIDDAKRMQRMVFGI